MHLKELCKHMDSKKHCMPILGQTGILISLSQSKYLAKVLSILYWVSRGIQDKVEGIILICY